MKQYLLAVHSVDDAAAPAPEAMQRAYQQVAVLNEELQSAGSWVFGGGLFPSDVATVVDGRGAETVVTDGPFGESKEHLGGFWILKLPDLDAALEIAARASAACLSPVEVRPFQEEVAG